MRARGPLTGCGWRRQGIATGLAHAAAEYGVDVRRLLHNPPLSAAGAGFVRRLVGDGEFGVRE